MFSFWIYFKMYFIPVIKAEFLTSLLQSSVSHDPLEIIIIFWFAAQKTIVIIIIIMLKTAESIFFRFPWWIESSEEQHLSEIEIFCNIINVFIFTFDQFKPSLLNKSSNFQNIESKLLNGIVYNVTKSFYFR